MVGLAALLLWVATALLTVTYDGNGSPVGQGLVMLLAIVATIGFISTARQSPGAAGERRCCLMGRLIGQSAPMSSGWCASEAQPFATVAQVGVGPTMTQ